MGIKFIGALDPVTVPGSERPTFITIYDFPDGDTPRLRFAVGDGGPVFDLPASEVRRMCSVGADWLAEG
jgi:hypothetical protein